MNLLKAATVAALALCFSIAPARAGSSTANEADQITPYVGSFSLPVEAHWGRAVLPAGNYDFDVTRLVSGRLTVVVRGQGISAILLSSIEDQPSGSTERELSLREVNGQYFVDALDLPGSVLRFSAPKATAEMSSAKSVPVR